MADAKMLKKVPVREQDPKVRATNNGRCIKESTSQRAGS